MESIMFWGFNLHAWITIATVLSMFTVLLLTKLRIGLLMNLIILAANILIVNIVYTLTPLQ